MNARIRTNECDRFELLLGKVKLTEGEMDFFRRHQETCPLGIHTKKGLERRRLRESQPDYFDRLLSALRRPITSSKQSLLRLVGMSSENFVPAFAVGTPHWLTGIVYAKYNEFRLRTRLPHDRREALTALLRPPGDIVYSAAKSHLGLNNAAQPKDWRQSGFPHDSAAIAAFRQLDPSVPELIPGDSRQAEVPPAFNLVAVGSPVSSDDVRLYLPYWKSDSPGLGFSETFHSDEIPYHFFMSNEKTIVVRSGAMNGAFVKKGENGIKISSSGRVWRPRHSTDRKGHLKTDFLIVTKLPRSRSGGDVVLMSGGHGAGAEAFRLLLDPKVFPRSELDSLMKAIGNAPYFQFVLECSDIRDDRDMSRAHNLSLSEDCPPQVIEPSAMLFKERANEQSGKE